MDFGAHQLADGRRFRALAVIDLFTRECLAIDVGHGLSGRDVVATLERLRFERGLPQRIYCNNGSEFVSTAMDLWAYTHGVMLDFSRRGKPTSNAAIESFNGRFREECLPDATSFLVADPKALVIATTIECAICETSASPATIVNEQKSFDRIQTQKIDGQDPTLTRVSWRPKVTPPIRPGGILTYICTVATKGTQRAAFSAEGSFAGVATPYPVNRLVFICYAPSGYRIDRTHFKVFLRTEDGDSPEIYGLPAPTFENGDQLAAWAFEGELVQILVNYLVQLRFIAS